MTQFASWDRSKLAYVLDGRGVPQIGVKASAEAVVAEARAQIRVLTDRLQGGQISLSEWYEQMQAATKAMHGAEIALARGGWDNMRPSDWERASQSVLNQWEGVEGKFPGLRSFAEDAARGRYGQGLESGAMNVRAQMYAEAGRAAYENERTAVHQESGYRYATRLAGAVDHCPTCQAENDVKREIDEVVEIGDSECGPNCHCVLIYSRD